MLQLNIIMFIFFNCFVLHSKIILINLIYYLNDCIKVVQFNIKHHILTKFEAMIF